LIEELLQNILMTHLPINSGRSPGVPKEKPTISQPKSKELVVIDTSKGNTPVIYPSIASFARELNIHPQNIATYLRNGSTKPFRGIYIIKKKS
jgi:hypothetical protein